MIASWYLPYLPYVHIYTHLRYRQGKASQHERCQRWAACARAGKDGIDQINPTSTDVMLGSTEEEEEEGKESGCMHALMSGWACRDEGRSGSGILGILRHGRIAVPPFRRERCWVRAWTVCVTAGGHGVYVPVTFLLGGI
jgi:hypothetical protein